ncbi:MAG: cytochrome c5 family protein [Betaproteobacteria bacterium]|nr:cytochrome c5 family protein [Betaproteobacteria bacterium]
MSDHENNAAVSTTNPRYVFFVFAFPPLFIMAFALVIVIYSSLFEGSKLKESEEAVAARIQPVARVELASASASAAKGSRTGEEIVTSTCAACHATGAAGAPKIGDKAAWAPRLGQGLSGLLKSATAGKNAMPPKGGSDATETELARAIVFMANKSGASFKEPVDKK